jgi:hypothetical protein
LEILLLFVAAIAIGIIRSNSGNADESDSGNYAGQSTWDQGESFQDPEEPSATSHHHHQERAEQENHQQKQENSKGQHSETWNTQEKYFGEILQLKGQITTGTIKSNYHKLVREYHPDKVMTLGSKLQKVAEEEMKLINSAYEYFKDKYNIR